MGTRFYQSRWLPTVSVSFTPLTRSTNPATDSVDTFQLECRKAILLLSLPPVPPSSHSRHPQQTDQTPSHPSDDIRLAALDLLVQSVKLEPYNWSAWAKIASCLEGPEEVSLLFPSILTKHDQCSHLVLIQLEATMPFLPDCYPLLFFYVHCTLEIHSAGEKLHSILDELESVFPGSSIQSQHAQEDGEDFHLREARDGEADEGGCSIIKGLRALVYYHIRGTPTVLVAVPTQLLITDSYSSVPDLMMCRFRRVFAGFRITSKVGSLQNRRCRHLIQYPLRLGETSRIGKVGTRLRSSREDET